MNEFEGFSPMWVVGILGFLIGIILGSITTYLASSRNGKTQQLQSELNDLKERFTDYRDTVTQHFMQTSNLVQEMTERYRAVYEHLANGAQHLCNVDTGVNHLSRERTDEIATAKAASTLAGGADFDYDDLAELSSIRDDIDQLMGESSHIPETGTKSETEDKTPLQH